MATVKLAGNGFGGTVQGNYGTYQAASDGSFTVDTRDAPSCLAIGMDYVQQFSQSYTTPIAPAAAGVGAIVASGALSNGTVAVTAQPDVPRAVTVEVGTGTAAISAGSAAVTYTGNDGLVGTDTFSLVCGASSGVTQFLSRGCVTISTITVSGVAGGTSPWLRMSRTAALSVPVPPQSVDVVFTREYDSGATIALGTPSSTILGTITPTTAPNGTVTYSWLYGAVSADT
jgi:hypothetical protein